MLSRTCELFVPNAEASGVHVLGQPRVVERGPGLGVADNEPGTLAVGQGDLVHRPAARTRANSGKGLSRS